jgi:hypothetical protein
VSLIFDSVLQFLIVSGLLQGEVGVVLELPDQKARVFYVSIALTRWFLKHVLKVLSEMSLRT